MTAVQDDALALVTFDDAGLVPAIAQQHDTGEVLMMAWMNEAALRATLATGEVHYWSRSRNSLWHKGETSGQTQKLVDFRIDCDGDTVLVLVDQTGVACHTGRRTCFFRSVRDGGIAEIEPVLVQPSTLYGG
jgi:phosphoribosyl-AMP cyclohydrolase